MDKEKTFWLFDICVAHRRENHWERHDVNKHWQNINLGGGGWTIPLKKKKKSIFLINSLLDTELGFTDLQKLSMKHVCGTVAVKHSLQSNRRFVSLCYVRILSRRQGDVLHINPCISLLCDCLTFADRGAKCDGAEWAVGQWSILLTVYRPNTNPLLSQFTTLISMAMWAKSRKSTLKQTNQSHSEDKNNHTCQWWVYCENV